MTIEVVVEPEAHAFDLFVAHAAPDTDFVRGYLLPALSPDGTRVVTASADKTVRVWDATTGKPVTAPLEHQGSVYAAVFSPDGTRVVTASYDNTARVWPLSSDMDSLDDWRRLARCSPFAFSNGVLTANSDPLSVCTAIARSTALR